jgi:hypothetical protein
MNEEDDMAKKKADEETEEAAGAAASTTAEDAAPEPGMIVNLPEGEPPVQTPNPISDPSQMDTTGKQGG